MARLLLIGLLGLALAASCATAEPGPAGTTTTTGGGEGGAGTSSSSSSSGGGDGGAGAEGGAGGATGAGGSGGGGAAGGAAEGGGGAGGGEPLPCAPPAGSADYPPETEPNEGIGEASSLAPPSLGFSAAICPAGDVDVFAVDLAAGESLRVAVSDGLGGCPAQLLPRVQVVDALDQVLAEEVGFGCAELDPAAFGALASPGAGTYYVRVQNNAGIAGSPYAIEIAALGQGCGDGLVQPGLGEQCDDGNDAAGDGCSPGCSLEGSFVQELESNDTSATATPLGGAEGAFGGLSPAGDVDYYSFEVTEPGSAVRALISDGIGGCPGGFDSMLVLWDAFDGFVASDDDGGPDLCSAIEPGLAPGATALPAGTYTLSVSHTLGDAQASYVLTVEVIPPGCGDAVIGPGEQCDDANRAIGDGCAPDCSAEAPWEIEPNGTQAEATAQWPGEPLWRARLLPGGDSDWFSFTVPQGASVTLSTNNLGAVGACSWDTVIHLFDSVGAELAFDDQDGLDSCSQLSPAMDPALAGMAAGTYYVWVHEFFGDPITGYELHLDVQ